MSDIRCPIGRCDHNLCGKCCNGGECDYDFDAFDEQNKPNQGDAEQEDTDEG